MANRHSTEALVRLTQPLKFIRLQPSRRAPALLHFVRPSGSLRLAICRSGGLPCFSPALARFGRIFTKLGLHGAAVLGAADEAVEVVRLPEGIQGAETRFVDQTTRNAFQALQRVGQISHPGA